MGVVKIPSRDKHFQFLQRAVAHQLRESRCSVGLRGANLSVREAVVLHRF
jgi:hypothetical protein